MSTQWIKIVCSGFIAFCLLACETESSSGEGANEAPGKVAREGVRGPDGKVGVCCALERVTECYTRGGGWAPRASECSDRRQVTADIPCVADVDAFGCDVVRAAPELCALPEVVCFGERRPDGGVPDGGVPDGGAPSDASGT